MALIQMSEVFGNDTAVSHSPDSRIHAWCPFRGTPCTKQGIEKPLGICSFSDGQLATPVCPVRFREEGRIFLDAGRAAFGPGVEIVLVAEVRLLEVPGKAGRVKKIGKVDYLIVRLDATGTPVDYAALEIQAAYISGKSVRGDFDRYLETGKLSGSSARRVDFRSSAQKRLMPQLALKVPIFRRWGKRFFVAVDRTLFESLPKIQTVHADNAEISWLVYDFERSESGGYKMSAPDVRHTLWDEVVNALREGTPPERNELLRQLARQVAGQQRLIT